MTSTPSTGRGPLRRTRGDLVVTAVFTALALLAVLAAWATASIRSVHAQPDLATAESNAAKSDRAAEKSDAAQSDALAPLQVMPDELTQVFSQPAKHLPGGQRPVIAGDRLIVPTAHGATAFFPDGTQAWSYERDDHSLCGLSQAWGKAVLVYSSSLGCGDVVALAAQTGNYRGTRSAINAEQPSVISSNDEVGTLAETRVELWRNDLVRTVEYGYVEAPQEPGFQPHAECRITSALTRKSLLAVTEVCPDQPESTALRILAAVPEDSREPEIHSSTILPTPDARLVAIGQTAAAVYVPGGDNQADIVSYSTKGKEIARESVKASPLYREATGAVAPIVADLPHYMSWFDGTRLYLFNPETLAVRTIIDGSLGTGVAIGDAIAVPTLGGITLLDPASGERLGNRAVDRPTNPQQVHLAVLGSTIVEQRDNLLVGLAAPTSSSR